MLIHTVLFLGYIFFDIVALLTETVRLKYMKAENYKKECQWIEVEAFFYALCMLINLTIICLITYMSVKFTRPLTDYW